MTAKSAWYKARIQIKSLVVPKVTVTFIIQSKQLKPMNVQVQKALSVNIQWVLMKNETNIKPFFSGITVIKGIVHPNINQRNHPHAKTVRTCFAKEMYQCIFVNYELCGFILIWDTVAKLSLITHLNECTRSHGHLIFCIATLVKKSTGNCRCTVMSTGSSLYSDSKCFYSCVLEDGKYICECHWIHWVQIIHHLHLFI